MAHSRTIISLPGWFGRNKDKSGSSTADTAAKPANELRANAIIKVQGRTIVGILYTVSRSLLGEIFPIYLGKTTVGSDPSCDICLREQSVLPNHALIVARRIETTDGNIHSSISVSPSVKGAEILVDGAPLDDDRAYCHNGQNISIGDHYRLAIVTLDPETFNLNTDSAFAPMAPLEDDAPAASASVNDPYAPVDERSTAYRDSIGEEDERAFYAPSRPKVSTASQTIVDKKVPSKK
ncbi:MAG: FHA domain-containing protein [Muribaculaceae bacterium]